MAPVGTMLVSLHLIQAGLDPPQARVALAQGLLIETKDKLPCVKHLHGCRFYWSEAETTDDVQHPWVPVDSRNSSSRCRSPQSGVALGERVNEHLEGCDRMSFGMLCVV